MRSEDKSQSAVDAALCFEAVKIAMTQDKNGVILKLSIHPNEVPKDLMTAWVGTRFQAALVQLDEDGSPVKGPDTVDGERAVKSAGMMARNERFQEYLHRQEFADEISEEAAVEAVKLYCDIGSRAELRNNEKARKEYWRLIAGFDEARHKGEV